MAQMSILYWRDIPSQVIVKVGRKPAKKLLSERFQEAIDTAAMRGKKSETDDYLAEWRRGDTVECSDDIEAEVRRLEKLGAKRIDNVRTWCVMEAPSGQRFCVIRPQRSSFEDEANTWQ